MKADTLYTKIAGILELQILTQVMKIGDKLPSIRTVGEVYQVSLNTAKQAYLELERKGLIDARPKSGYYVSQSLQRKLSYPKVSKPPASLAQREPGDLMTKVFDTLEKPDICRFSLGVPDSALMPVARLNKGLIKATQTLADSGIGYGPVQGHHALRNQVAHWAYVWGGQFTSDDLVTTSGAMNAIQHCLMATTQPGDTIAVESPTYFGFLQLAKSFGLRVIELPTHPVTGVEPDALRKVLHKIKACFFISNFNNPLGSCMPEEHKREVVQMLSTHGIPLIEDDLYGDIFFDQKRPLPCKAFDEEGLVLWCGSVSKSLSAGYRVGWVAPGKYKEKILRQKLLSTMATPTIFEEVVADFMENGRYDHHLRNLRSTLHNNSLQFLQAIEQHFPEGTRVTRPKGGFMLWLELDQHINTEDLFDIALRQKIGITPGRLFTLQNQFNNCLRLSYGLQWIPRVSDSLERLGRIIRRMGS
jgi:DNA-binding transcriptional MocR family regulator